MLDKLKIKPVIGYIENYRRKWKEHVNKKNTKINFALSAGRTSINWTSKEEIGGKCETITSHLP
jgi:hypothetical protein